MYCLKIFTSNILPDRRPNNVAKSWGEVWLGCIALVLVQISQALIMVELELSHCVITPSWLCHEQRTGRSCAQRRGVFGRPAWKFDPPASVNTAPSNHELTAFSKYSQFSVVFVLAAILFACSNLVIPYVYGFVRVLV